MTLILHSHPLASFCWKVLVALYEAGTPFEARLLDLGDDAARAAHLDRWPVGKMPLLIDEARGEVVPETTIILEYLDRHYPGPEPLLPAAPEAALEVRLWDRFFDLYVHQPMQKIVTDRLRPEKDRDPFGVAEARAQLQVAYGMVETRMASRAWACGAAFTLADCAAMPALFYAGIVEPWSRREAVPAYFDRLLERPAVARVIAEARPFFGYFPYAEAMPARLRDG